MCARASESLHFFFSSRFPPTGEILLLVLDDAVIIFVTLFRPLRIMQSIYVYCTRKFDVFHENVSLENTTKINAARGRVLSMVKIFYFSGFFDKKKKKIITIVLHRDAIKINRLCVLDTSRSCENTHCEVANCFRFACRFFSLELRSNNHFKTNYNNCSTTS